MEANEAALLGLTSLLVLIVTYGVFKWFASRSFEDDGHRGPLAAAAVGNLLATNLVLIVGTHPVAMAAGLVPWLMVAFFTYPEHRGMSLAAGAVAWAVWWGVHGAASAMAGLADAL